MSFLTWDNIIQFPYLKIKKNKNDKTGGQKQCTETNMSKANFSKSIVYIEYSWCYEEHTKLYYTYFKLFIVSWYFFIFFKLLEWILNGLAE